MLINFINQATCYKQPFKSACSKLYSKYQKLSKNQKISLIAATTITSSLAICAIVSRRKSQTTPKLDAGAKKQQIPTNTSSTNAHRPELQSPFLCGITISLLHTICPEAEFSYLKEQINNPFIANSLKRNFIEKLNPSRMATSMLSDCNNFLLELMEDNTLDVDLRLVAADNTRFCESSFPSIFKKFMQTLQKIYQDFESKKLKGELAFPKKALCYYYEFSEQSISEFLEIIQDSSFESIIQKELIDSLNINLKNKLFPCASADKILQQLTTLLQQVKLHSLQEGIFNTMGDIVKKHPYLLPKFISISFELYSELHEEVKKVIQSQLNSIVANELPRENIKELHSFIKKVQLQKTVEEDTNLRNWVFGIMVSIVKNYPELFTEFVQISIELVKNQNLNEAVKKEIIDKLQSCFELDKQPRGTLRKLQQLITNTKLHNDPKIDISLREKIYKTIKRITTKHPELFPEFAQISIELVKNQDLDEKVREEILDQLWLHSELDKQPRDTLTQLQQLITDTKLHNDPKIDISLRKKIYETIKRITKKHPELFPEFAQISIELVKNQDLDEKVREEILDQLWLYSKLDKQPRDTLTQLQQLITDTKLHNDPKIDISLRKKIYETIRLITTEHPELSTEFVQISIELVKNQNLNEAVKKEILDQLQSCFELDKQPRDTLTQLQQLITETKLHDDPKIDISLRKKIYETIRSITTKHPELFPEFVQISIELVKNQDLDEKVREKIPDQLWLHSELDKQPRDTLTQLQQLITDTKLHNDPKIDISLRKKIYETIKRITKKHPELFPEFVQIPIELVKNQDLDEKVREEILDQLWIYSELDKQPRDTLTQLQQLITDTKLHNDPKIDISLRKKIYETIRSITTKHPELFPEFVQISIELVKNQDLDEKVREKIPDQLWLHSELDKQPRDTLTQLQQLITDTKLHNDPKIDISLRKKIYETIILITAKHPELFPESIQIPIELVKNQDLDEKVRENL